MGVGYIAAAVGHATGRVAAALTRRNPGSAAATPPDNCKHSSIDPPEIGRLLPGGDR